MFQTQGSGSQKPYCCDTKSMYQVAAVELLNKASVIANVTELYFGAGIAFLPQLLSFIIFSLFMGLSERASVVAVDIEP